MLRIGVSHSAITHELYVQGPDIQVQERCNSTRVVVHSLILEGVGAATRYIMPCIDPVHMHSLSINNCLHIAPVLERLRTAPLTKFYFYPLKYSTRRREETAHDHYIRFRNQLVTAKRDVLDFLRSAMFKLKKLCIIGEFTDKERRPRHKSGLSPDLFFAVQTHLGTLDMLSVINEGTDFTKEEFEEIGQCTPNLLDLRVSSRMGPRFHERDEEEEDEGLSVSHDLT